MRECSVKSLSAILTNPPEQFLTDTFTSHHEYVIDTLLIHFDDNDEVLQTMILGEKKMLYF